MPSKQHQRRPKYCVWILLLGVLGKSGGEGMIGSWWVERQNEIGEYRVYPAEEKQFLKAMHSHRGQRGQLAEEWTKVRGKER